MLQKTRILSPILSRQHLSTLHRFRLLTQPYLLLDLKQLSPPLWERVKQAHLEFQQQLQRFYQQGMAQGIFHPLKPMLVVLQNELFLRTMMDPVFLMEQDLTLRTLLSDYYELLKYQWLLPAFAEQIDDAPVRAFIDRVIHKFALR
jgi:hypothetical protein